MPVLERPNAPTLRAPWITRWLASSYLAESGAYRHRLEAYADHLESGAPSPEGERKPDIRVEERDSAWLEEALRGLPGYGDGVSRIQLDRRYWACSIADFDKVVASDPTDEKTYAAGQFDCDNFSFTFKARVGRQYGINAVGVVINTSSAHAYNVVAFLDGPPRLFEPQSDEWPELGTGDYKFESGLVII